MRKFLLRKLVRNKIPTIMEAQGQQVEHRKLDDIEFLRESGRKVLEEIAEFDPAEPDPKELVDIIESAKATIQAASNLAIKLGLTPVELEALGAKLLTERGGFDERVYIESVTLADDDSWVGYYSKEPDRYMEVKSE